MIVCLREHDFSAKNREAILLRRIVENFRRKFVGQGFRRETCQKNLIV